MKTPNNMTASQRETLRDLYRAERAAQLVGQPLGQYWPGGAVDALCVARHAMARAWTNAQFPLSVPRHSDESKTTRLPGGDTLTIRIEADDDASARDFGDGYDVNWTHGRADCFQWEKSGNDFWIDRRAGDVIYFRGLGRHYDAATVTVGTNSGYGWQQFEDDARNRNMPRGLVPLYACHHMQEQARSVIELFRSETCAYGFTVTLCDAAGAELFADSLWGIDDFEYAQSEAENVARAFIARRCEALRESLPQWRENMKGLRIRYRVLNAERKLILSRAVPGSIWAIDAPEICALLNGELRTFRGAFRYQLNALRECVRTLASYADKGITS